MTLQMHDATKISTNCILLICMVCKAYFVAVCERGWSNADIQVFVAIQVDEELNFLLDASDSKLQQELES